VQVLGIDKQESANVVKNWGDHYGLSYPLLLDTDGALYDDYGDGYIPYNVVIDQNMVVQYSEHGYDEAAIIQVIEDLLAMPVELSSFVAKCGDNRVELNWTTASETNNLGFQIEKSTDKLTYEPVGFVHGHQTVRSSQDYSFIDKNVAPSNYYYRLKQIDTDGQYEYSGVVEVEIGVPDKYSLSQNYPNPFNPVTTLRYDLPDNNHVTLTIYDLNGREINLLININQPAGHKSVQWNATDSFGKPVSAGVYLYQIRAGEFVQTRKMVLLK